MSVFKTATVCEPTPAERVRTVLAAADSLSATTVWACEEVMVGAAVEFGAGTRLRLPADCHLAGEARAAGPGGMPAVLEWTDVAPVPVAVRVRAQVRVLARLYAPEPGPAGTVRLRADLRQVGLTTEGRATALVAPRALATALPDPLATAEARLLLHLAEDHQDHVEALARLLNTRQLLGVTRVTPLALDRYGIVLRLDYGRRRQDVRLRFLRPLSDPDDLGHHLHALLAQGHRPRGLA
ncbi:hypothetical protein RVR_417 [Actinacidiphila reveromycinica]|uniref:DUF2470 domain-containing protein n=1 Tax=Actinacidiphila reveromycinica TaxID=659352 RepID=A0A7U3UMX9_9ACTN|nr:DUF2470 domain-containing protein [Streptomyces sp. SN-593]BBA95526.1 hypothetical protein RVR_417 [Streptomyces sp. SN-593]